MGEHRLRVRNLQSQKRWQNAEGSAHEASFKTDKTGVATGVEY